MPRPRTVYRGRRRYGWVLPLVLLIVCILVAAAAWIYVSMQKYIVYDKDSLHVVLPYMREESTDSETAGSGTAEEVDAEIVVEETDYSDLETDAGADVQDISVQYVSGEQVNATSLGYYGYQVLNGGDANAIMVLLKDTDGYLSYHSNVALATSYGVNGTAEIADAVLELHESGVYMIAEIAVLVDETMAVRNAPLALRSASGDIITDSYGAYLDPYNTAVRTYVTDLMTELAEMGFDEVVFSGLLCPRTDNIVYSVSMTGTPSAAAGVSGFAVHLQQTARELGLKLSAVCEAEPLRAGTSTEYGQDLSVFFKVFDRVYVKTDSYYANGDVSLLEEYLGSADSARIIPLVQ